MVDGPSSSSFSSSGYGVTTNVEVHIHVCSERRPIRDGGGSHSGACGKDGSHSGAGGGGSSHSGADGVEGRVVASSADTG